MLKKDITKQKIFDAAKIIAHMDKEPTINNVREFLAFTGSQTTLHKYLKEWKLKCFQTYESTYVKSLESKDIAKLQAEKQSLTATIGKMEEHNKIVSSEFAKTERKNVELTQNLTQLAAQLSLLDAEIKDLKKDKEQADNLYQELKAEREILLGRLERDKDQLIVSLREELSQTHQVNLQIVQDISYRGHDLLMQEKVKVMNLEEKVRSLSDELTKLHQEFNRASRVVEPLKTQIKQLQKLIAKNLSIEQLKEYEKKQILLDFASN